MLFWELSIMAVRFYSKNITATNPNSFHKSLSTENPLPLTLNNSSFEVS